MLDTENRGGDMPLCSTSLHSEETWPLNDRRQSSISPSDLTDNDFNPALVALVHQFILLRRHTESVSGKRLYVSIQSLKMIFSLLVAGFNAILFYKQSKALAKNYFSLGEFGQGVFAFSDSYANFFLSVYTSLSLINMLSHFVLLSKTNPGHSSTKCMHFSLFFLSVISSLPMIAPLSNESEQVLTLVSNTLLSMYALYEFHVFSRSRGVFVRMAEQAKQHISYHHAVEFEGAAQRLPRSVLGLIKRYSQQEMERPQESRLRWYAVGNALFGVLTVVTPYILAMIDGLDDTSQDNGFLKYFISSDAGVRSAVAISVAVVSNLPFAILCAYFGYNIVYECHTITANKYSIARQYYPKVWLFSKVFQVVITSLSWSTPVKLYLDYFGGPEFVGKSALDLFFVIASSVLIGVGVFVFNLYSNLKLSDTMIESYAALFGENSAKLKLEFINLVDALVLHVNLVKKYDVSSYRGCVADIEATASLARHAGMWKDGNKELRADQHEEARVGHYQTVAHVD